MTISLIILICVLHVHVLFIEFKILNKSILSIYVLFNNHLKNMMAFYILLTVFGMGKSISAPGSHFSLCFQETSPYFPGREKSFLTKFLG